MSTLPHTGTLKELSGINHYSIIINHYSFWTRQGGYELLYHVCSLWDAQGDHLPHAISPEWSRSPWNQMSSLQDFSCTGDRVALHVSNQMPLVEFPLVKSCISCRFLSIFTHFACHSSGVTGAARCCVCVCISSSKIFWLWKNIQKDHLAESESKSTWRKQVS